MFHRNQEFLILDYETFSKADIKKVGSYEYARHDSTEILCASFKYGLHKSLRGAEVFTWHPIEEWNECYVEEPKKIHQNGNTLARLLCAPNVLIVAHNALFEQAITRFVLPKYFPYIFKIPHDRFVCTAVLASVYALPRKLEGVCEALNLDHQKDKEGHRLMLKMSKPRRPTKNNPSERHTDYDDFKRLIQYCEQDIHAETDVFLELEPMIQSERDLWILDQKMNFKGVKVDTQLIDKILDLIKIEKRNLTNELIKITNNEIQSGGQTAEILKWLEKRGVFLPNLQKKTVEDAIKEGLVNGETLRVLELRQWLNKTSLKKYTAFKNHTQTDGVVRFNLNFHAASTGRWGGAGVQLQNLPRPSLKQKDVDFALEIIKDCNNPKDTLEALRFLVTEPLEVFVSLLRSVLIAREGKELFVTDFAAIEARMLFWLADHHDGVKAFKDGRKMYEEMGALIFNRSPEEILHGSFERFVGKQTILGSGYGLGWKKFIQMCELFGQQVSEDVAKKAIKSYRELHKPVTALWKNLEDAAIKAVAHPDRVFKANHTEWFMKGRFLCCKLPSGRCLFYCDPEIKVEPTPWGDSKRTLHHWGVDAKTKKWCRQKTWGGTLTENVVQAISRDLLAAGMFRVSEKGYEVILTVHDEIIGERKKGTGNLKEFNDLMTMLPPWAKGAPIDVEGFVAERYRK